MRYSISYSIGYSISYSIRKGILNSIRYTPFIIVFKILDESPP